VYLKEFYSIIQRLISQHWELEDTNFYKIIIYSDSFVLRVNVVLVMGCQSGVGHFISVIKFYTLPPSWAIVT